MVSKINGNSSSLQHSIQQESKRLLGEEPIYYPGGIKSDESVVSSNTTAKKAPQNQRAGLLENGPVDTFEKTTGSNESSEGPSVAYDIKRPKD